MGLKGFVMKVLISINVIGKKDTCKVYKLFDLSCIPIHNSILCLSDGPSRRLGDSIPIESIGLNFRIDSKNVYFIAEKDSCLIEGIDETQKDLTLSKILKEYSDSGWKIGNE